MFAAGFVGMDRIVSPREGEILELTDRSARIVGCVATAALAQIRPAAGGRSPGSSPGPRGFR